MAYITMKLVEIWISLPPLNVFGFSKKSVMPSLANNGNNSTSIQYHGISKNDNIKKSVNKLDKQINIADRSLGLQQVVCIFSYGPHIQKMLSILEIFKKDYIKSNKKIYQE